MQMAQELVQPAQTDIHREAPLFARFLLSFCFFSGDSLLESSYLFELRLEPSRVVDGLDRAVQRVADDDSKQRFYAPVERSRLPAALAHKVRFVDVEGGAQVPAIALAHHLCGFGCAREPGTASEPYRANSGQAHGAVTGADVLTLLEDATLLKNLPSVAERLVAPAGKSLEGLEAGEAGRLAFCHAPKERVKSQGGPLCSDLQALGIEPFQAWRVSAPGSECLAHRMEVQGG